MDNILSMSDEDILAMSPADREKLYETPATEPTPEPEKPVQEEEQQEQVQEPVVEQQEQEQEQEEEQEQQEETQQEEVQKPDAELTEEEKAAAAEKLAQAPATPEVPSKDDKSTPAKEEPAVTVKPEDELAKLFTAFKASGRDFKVNSVDEAIQLMQKGVNYHDKMHGLKPVMGIARMLERNGLLDEGKLSYLIDLHNKKPEAIAKLVKESGVDTLEIDDKQVAAYKPESKALTVQENALEDALSDLQQYSSHDRVIGMVNKQFDAASRKMVLENPHVLLHIASQVDSGVYDIVQAEIDKQRILGNLKGVSDLQAYDVVGKALHEQGAFNHLNQPKPPVQQPAPVVVAPKPQAPKQTAAAKQAAAPAKATTAKPVAPKDFNPLAMSDEEFLKLAGKPL